MGHPVKSIKRAVCVLLSSCVLFAAHPAMAQTRIKDIVDVESVRENQLVGYGLVVGLKGTGDRLRNSPFTEVSLKAMMERMGVSVRDMDMKTANVAAVTVTANLPSYARKGSRFDVQVAALGDARSLQGGVLIATTLLGFDGEVYGVAQGSVAVSGFEARGAAASVNRGSTTAGRVANGAIVEREVNYSMGGLHELKLALKNPDFTTASMIAREINRAVGSGTALAMDPSTVQLTLPNGYRGTMVDLVVAIEKLPISVDQVAKIVIDEASGTVVMGDNVKVSRVAIAQGNLTISVAETPIASQPNAFSNGETVVLPRTQINVDDGQGRKLAIVDKNVSLRDLVNGLNALGVTPRDLITILQSLKAAGAIQADIEVL